MRKSDLDKRICDVEGVSNTQTYREFIEEGELEFGINPVNLDKLTEKELNDYLNWIDELYLK